MAASDDLLNQWKQEQQLSTAPVGNATANTSGSDALLSSWKNDLESNITISVQNAAKGSPEKAAEVQKVARMLSVPSDTVEKNWDDLNAFAKTRAFQMQRNAADDPILARQYADPNFAAIAYDDYENTSQVGKNVRNIGKPAEHTFGGVMRDIGVVGMKAAMSFDQTIVGLLDIPTQGWVGKKLEDLGLNFKEAQDIAQGMYSPSTQEAWQKFNTADGLVDKAAAAITNPSVIATTVGESIPSMYLGGQFTKWLGAMRGLEAAPFMRLAIGEGAVTSGQIAEQIRSEEKSGMLTEGQVMASVAAGGVTGLLGRLGAKVAQRLGITDLEAYVAGINTANPAKRKWIGTQILEGAAAEGVLEELPQSIQEQMWQNLAQDKPVFEGVNDAAVLGLFAGMAMGGGGPIVAYPANVRAEKAAARAAEEKAKFMDALGQLVAANKIMGRDPEAVQRYVEQVSEETGAQNIFIKADALRQSGLAEQIAAVIPSVGEQLNQAVSPDQEIQISIPDYTTKISGTEANAALVDNIRVEGEKMTRAEAREFIDNESTRLQEEYLKSQNTKVAFDDFKKSSKALEQNFEQQFNQSGLYTKGDSKVLASLNRFIFDRLAIQMNTTPEEVHKQFPFLYGMEGQQQADHGLSQLDINSDNFKSWFGNSVFKDDAGKPVVLYHGTADNVTEFDLNHPNRKDTGWLGTGVYLTDSTDMADAYAMQKRNTGGARPNVMPLYAKLENPYYATDEDKARIKAGGKKAADAFTKQLQEQGHDGIIYQAAPDAKEVVVFDPTSVKSIFNGGAFDPNNPDILMQRGQQKPGKPVPSSVDAVSNVEAAFQHAAGQTFKTNRDFKLDIQNRVLDAAKKAKIDLSEFTQAVEQYLVRVAVADSVTALDTNPNAVGWYNEKVTKALSLISLIHPEIATDPQAKFAFTWALAVTSNGLKVDKNFELAERAYRYYKDNGKMPTNLEAGTAQIAINSGLDLFNELIEKHGFETVEKFMTTRQTVKEVEAFTGRNVSGENLTTEVYGAAALGPKIGNGFFANLYGHFEQLTMDRWLMRTWGRWTGSLVEENKANVKNKRDQLKSLIKAMTAQERTAFEKIIKAKLLVGKNDKLDAVAKAINKASMKPANRVAMAEIGRGNEKLQAKFEEILGPLKKNQTRIGIGDELRKVGNSLTGYLDGQKEAPSGPPERARIRKVMAQVLDQMQQQYPALTMSDLQALLWYPEKRLYDAAKTAEEGETSYEDDEAPDYANAAAALAKQLGVSQDLIDKTIKEVDDGLQAAELARRTGRGAGNSISEEGAGETARTESEQNLVDAINENGGITLNPDGTVFSGDKGYIATLRSITVDSVEDVPEAIKAYAEENAGLLGLDGVVIGAFAFNDGTGRVSVDLNIVTQDQDLAVRIGQEMNQISVWDIANSEEIKTGGTSGEGLSLNDAEAFIRNLGEQHGIRYQGTEGPAFLAGVANSGVAQGGVEGLRQSGFAGAGGVQRLRAGDQAVRSAYGTAREGSSSVIGIHYSRGSRESLSGQHYGQGLKDAAGARLQQSDDQRLQNRIHFYVDTGTGVAPESGVGAYAHGVNLNNLYNTDEDPLGLMAAARSAGGQYWFNNFESSVIDAGFDGVFVPKAQGNQGVAVLLGDHADVPVDQLSKPQAARQPVFTQFLNQPTRGYIDPKRLVAILTPDADRSTPGHELAHAVVEIYTRIANTENAPAEIVSDLDKLLEFAGVQGATQQERLASWSSMDLEAQRPFHEAIAYNWEVYLAEGKAPSLELQTVFDRLSAWIRDLYTAVRDRLNDLYKEEFGKDLPVMTEGVREVFDRMLASQDQIAQAEAVRNMQVLFDGKPEGMDDATWAALQQLAEEARDASVSKLTTDSLRQMRWLSNAKMKIIKQMQRENAALRAEVRQQVEAQIKASPIYKAIQFIKDGEIVLEDGTVQKSEGLHKISISGLEDLYMGEGDRYALFDWSKLPKSMYGTEGIHPDVLAEQLGFQSGDQLVRTLIEAPSLKEAVNKATDERMLAEHGDMNNQREIDLAVERALHNEARSKFVAAQLRFVSRATAPARVMIEAAKRAAQNIIGGKMIKDLKPSEYSIAESRANREAITAQKKGDNQGLIRAMQAALVNNQLAGVAAETRSEIDKGLVYLRSVTNDNNRKRIGADAADQIDAMLSRFDLSMPGNRIKTLAEWIASQTAAGLEPDLPASMLDEKFSKPYKLMTVQEFNDLLDSVKQIEHFGRNEQRLLTAAKDIAYKEARDQIVESIVDNSRGRTADNRTAKTNMGRAMQGLKHFWAEHIKAATIVRVLDGGKAGPFWEYLIRPANAAADKETAMRAKATEDLTRILAPILKGKTGGKGILVPAVGRALNKEERVAIALNMGNTSNEQRLLSGEGWSQQQAVAVMSTLTAEELKAVQQVWDYFEYEMRPQVAAQWRRLYGKEPQWIDAREITVTSADGQPVTLRGGYYPVVFDPMANDAASQQSKDDTARMETGYISANIKASFAKSRVAAVEGRPLMLSLTGIYRGLNEQIHSLAWQEFMVDAKRLLRSRSINAVMREHYPAQYKEQLNDWIRDIAVEDRKAADAGSGAINFIRRGVSSAGLGFNLLTALQQVTGLASSMVRLGPGYTARGVYKLMANPVEMSRKINSMSTLMANRGRTQFRELNELRNMVQGETKVMRGIRAGTYLAMAQMQRMVDLPTWWGAYEKAIGEGNDEARAIAIADQTVIDTQGNGTIKDLSKLERGGPGLKLFTVFYSYMNTQLNLGVAEAMTERSKAKLAAKALLLTIVPVVLNYAIKNGLTPDGGDDDWDWEKIAKDLAAEGISYMLGFIVFAREFSNASKIVVGAEGGNRGYSGPSGARPISDAYTFLTQAHQGEFDDAFRKAAINLIGDFTGLPSAQINRTINGVDALVEGKTQNPAAVLTGFQKK